MYELINFCKTTFLSHNRLINILSWQLEDAEFAKTAALKARQSADAELAEIQSSLEEAQRARKEAEERASRLLKEKSELQTQVHQLDINELLYSSWILMNYCIPIGY